jgi:hypothetical protein
MSDEKTNFAEIENYESCIRRLQMLIEVTDGTMPLHKDTQRNVHDDLIEIRSFLLRADKFL